MSSTSPPDPFDTVAFLAGSPNRIAVLDALVTLGSVSRRDLVDEVGVSRVTVGRIVDEFEARGWATRHGTEYRVTPIGEVVGDTFGSLLRTIASMDRLSTVLPWLPADFDIDVRRLETARITVPTWSDSVAPIRRAAQITAGLDVLRVCASGVAPDVIKGIRDAAVEDGADVEVVMTRSARDVITHDRTMWGWFDDLLDVGGRIYDHPGHPYLIAICDQTAVIGVNDDAGMPRGLVESSDSAVLDWVCSTIGRCREEAHLVETWSFAE